MKSKYNIFKGALDLGFFHVKFQETEYMILSEQGRVFSEVAAGITNLLQSFDLIYWGYLVPFKLIIEGIRLANTWSHLEGVPFSQLGWYAPSTACLLPFALVLWREISNCRVSF